MYLIVSDPGYLQPSSPVTGLNFDRIYIKRCCGTVFDSSNVAMGVPLLCFWTFLVLCFIFLPNILSASWCLAPNAPFYITEWYLNYLTVQTLSGILQHVQMVSLVSHRIYSRTTLSSLSNFVVVLFKSLGSIVVHFQWFKTKQQESNI